MMLCIGDVVQAIPGSTAYSLVSTPLTVEDVNPDGIKGIACIWFDKDDKIHRAVLQESSLQKIGNAAKAGDPVNPNHYKDLGEYSPIHVIERWALGFHLGQVLKYIGRAGKKPGEPALQDLKKARWYLDRFIEQQEKRS